MPEPSIYVANREQLVYLLSEAAEIEHGLMCCYLYAAFSLKRTLDEGLEPHELAAVDRFRREVHDIAREEMLHLALVANLMTALGAAPHLMRPNLPVSPGYHPSGVQLSLTPFDRATLDHFVYMERPEGVELPDGAGFVSSHVYRREVLPGRLMPSAQDFLTVGHLYRGIREGLQVLTASLGPAKLFCGDVAGQVDERVFPLEGLVAVRDLASAERAIDRILAQGEGTESTQADSHFARFSRIRDELIALEDARPGFVAARPVPRNPVMRRPAEPEGRVHVDAPHAARVLDLANAVYTLVIRMLGRIFGPSDETPEDVRTYARLTIELMQVMTAVSDVLTTLPASARHPGLTAGITFTMSRSLDTLPQRDAALRICCERSHELARAAHGIAEDFAPALAPVAKRLDRIADTLGHAFHAHAPAPVQAAAPQPSPPQAAAAPADDAAEASVIGEDGVERVRGKRLVLGFEAKRCIHARHCVLGAPRVFLANVKGPWLHPDADTVEDLVAIAHMCPSGAITYERTDGGPNEPVPEVNAMRLRENGPYAFVADVRLQGRKPITRATLCRCGASKNKPFCDGSHNDVGFTATGEPATLETDPLAARGGALEVMPQPNGPLFVSGNLEICAGTGRTVDRVTSARLCRCGGSSKKPYCDGTHARIGFQAD